MLIMGLGRLSHRIDPKFHSSKLDLTMARVVMGGMNLMVGMVAMAAAYPSYLVEQADYMQCYVEVSPQVQKPTRPHYIILFGYC